jgi:hypothetical protein
MCVIVKIALALIIGALLCACNGYSGAQPLGEFIHGGIGQPVTSEEAIVSRATSFASSIGWQRTTYPLKNGYWVFIEPDGPRSFIHWEVNQRGIIIGAKHEVVGRGQSTKGQSFWYKSGKAIMR